MLSAFFPGLLLCLSLIVAIGAQNAFVLRQGLRSEHVLAVCLTCAFSDALLILAGVGGFSEIGSWVPWFETATRYAGAACPPPSPAGTRPLPLRCRSPTSCG